MHSYIPRCTFDCFIDPSNPNLSSDTTNTQAATAAAATSNNTMGQVNFRDGIAIIQLIVFAPALIAAVMLCFRHGLSKAGGSLLIVTFTLTRLIGAICQLVSISSPSRGLATAELVTLYIGLSPLTLVCWGVLGRV